MALYSVESVAAVERRKCFWGSKEDTLLLISRYREHEKLFGKVNCKKKSIWELIRAGMVAKKSKFQRIIWNNFFGITFNTNSPLTVFYILSSKRKNGKNSSTMSLSVSHSLSYNMPTPPCKQRTEQHIFWPWTPPCKILCLRFSLLKLLSNKKISFFLQQTASASEYPGYQE